MPCRMYAYVHANLWRGFLFGGISARQYLAGLFMWRDIGPPISGGAFYLAGYWPGYLAGLFTWRDIGPDIWRGFLLDPHSVGAINDDDD